jgi:hypothetical protein
MYYKEYNPKELRVQFPTPGRHNHLTLHHPNTEHILYIEHNPKDLRVPKNICLNLSDLTKHILCPCLQKCRYLKETTQKHVVAEFPTD